MPSENSTDARLAHVDLMNRYAHAMDTRDWSLFASLFAEDCMFTAQHGLAKNEPDTEIMTLTGRDTMVAQLAAIIESLSATHHMLSNYVVDIAADGATAKASCYFRAYHAGAGPRSHLFEESLGRFDLQTLRVGAEWKIRRMEEYIMIMLGTSDAFGVGP